MVMVGMGSVCVCVCVRVIVKRKGWMVWVRWQTPRYALQAEFEFQTTQDDGGDEVNDNGNIHMMHVFFRREKLQQAQIALLYVWHTVYSHQTSNLSKLCNPWFILLELEWMKTYWNVY